MSKHYYLLSVCLITLLLCGCASQSETEPPFDYKVTKKDHLTRAELTNLINHGQHFAVYSSSVKKHLTKSQQRHILNTRPSIDIKYSGYKHGILVMRWRLTRDRDLTLRSKGQLNARRQNWKLEILTTNKNGPQVEGFIAKELEGNIGLPPK